MSATGGYIIRNHSCIPANKPTVKRACKLCGPMPQGRHGVVSPRGIEHMPMLTEPGNTVCCADYSAEGWWLPS